MNENTSIHTVTSEIRLRPHHLLCLQTFTGFGYSKEFIENMTFVKRQLADNPLTYITLVHGADDICAHCPNCVEGRCISEKPPIFDRKTTEKLKACKQCTYSVSLPAVPKELRVNEKILDECCPGCEWIELCKAVKS